MINRHLLRIKVLQVLYAYHTQDSTTEKALKELERSVKQSRELYARLLLLPLEMRDIAEQKFENAQQLLLAEKDENVQPLNRLIANRFLEKIANSKDIMTFCRNEKISWAGSEDVLLNLYNQMQAADFFKEYLANEDSFDNDKQFVENFFTLFVKDNEAVDNLLEEQSIYWNDDLWSVLPYILTVIKRTKETRAQLSFPEVYKKADDALFARNLLMKTIRRDEENKKQIQSITTNWEYERIALIDRILMGMAIVELLDFESIPVKVTLNEYVELSKYYSTENSSTFINGILDKIAKKEAAHTLKKGAGLVGN